jgi:hypothetical protein
MVKMVI